MVSSQFAMKRTSGGLHKRVARMNLDTNMDSGDQLHDETAPTLSRTTGTFFEDRQTTRMLRLQPFT